LWFFWWGRPCHSRYHRSCIHEFASCQKVAFTNGCVANGYFFQHYWIVKSNVFDLACFFWIEVPWSWSHHNWIYEFFPTKVNGDILLELFFIRHSLGHSKQL
jgi:hypothetical protein